MGHKIILESKLIRGDKREDGSTILSVKIAWLNWYEKYETAIIHQNGARNIIERYETEEECRTGHEKYLNMSQEEFDKLEFIG